MGLFGCSHKWRKYKGKHDGIQQWKCTKCSRLRNRKVRPCLFNTHRFRLDRRMKPPALRCKKCGITREARQ